MGDDPALAGFQAALLALLDEGLAPEALRERLRTDDAFAPYRAYVERLDPRCLALATELVRKWGEQAG